MPGETRIFKSTDGWYDVDNPTDFHPTREACRDARRGSPGRQLGPAKAVTQSSFPSQSAVPTRPATPSLNGLQNRLMDRLTLQQGVGEFDALAVITTRGYGQAASYGHMRAAGATHTEALSVIDLGSPAVSLTYGMSREYGDNHDDALADALALSDDDD